MYRTFLSVLLLAAASGAAHAQDTPVARADAASATAAVPKPRPRNAFSQAIADLTRAAREQHEAASNAASGHAPAPASPRRDTRAPVPVAAALATAGADGR